MNGKLFSLVLLTVLTVCFATSVLALESTSWNALLTIRPGQKIELGISGEKTIRGEFSAYDEESISLIKNGNIVTYPRERVLSVSLQGASKRKKHALLGAAIGAGAGLALGLISAHSDHDEGFKIVSDQAVTGSLLAVGAGAGALVGAAVPAHSYGVIYEAPSAH